MCIGGVTPTGSHLPFGHRGNSFTQWPRANLLRACSIRTIGSIISTRSGYWGTALGSNSLEVAQDLAKLYVEQGRYEEAEPLYQRALHIWEQAWGSEHPEVANALENLAELIYRMKNDGKTPVKRGSEELPLLLSSED